MALDDLYFSNVRGGAAAPKVLSNPTSTTAGGVYMAKLGDYMFGLDTAAFQQLQRTTEYRWSLINRIGREPAAQFVGLGEDNIELSGVIYSHFRGGIAQVGLMRASAAAGEPLPLVYSFEQGGQFCGRWCIKSIREGRTDFFRDGKPRKIEFSLSLTYYGEDAGGSKLSTLPSIFSGVTTALPAPALLGVSAAPLLTSASKVASLPPITTASPASDIAANASAVRGLSGSVAGVAGTVRSAIAGSITTLSAAARAVIPPEALTAASELVKSADSLLSANREVAATMAVFKGSPAGILGGTRDYDSLLRNVARSATLNGGTAKAASINLAAKGHSADVPDADRIAAAASMGNIARAADNLLFGAAEGSRQANLIAGGIRV